MTRPLVVLLVEDDPDEARLLEIVLGQTGIDHELHVATTGEDALERLRRRGPCADQAPIDLVLLDVHLPGIDGYAVLDEIRADPALRAIRVVLQTSAAARDAVRLGRRHGADDTIAKPTTAEGLGAVMRPAIG